jgi:hypothetical protein
MSKHRRYFLVFIVCSILIYELPYFLTLRKTGWTQLPPVLSGDMMLYLNLSNIHYTSATEVVNPWYGNLVPAIDVPYLRFPITFFRFRLTHGIFGSWTSAMLVWTAIWAALTFVAAVFCLDSLFRDSDRWLTITGAFGLLVLQSPLTYAAEIRQLPSIRGLFELALPYSRFAFPQVVVPVVFAYLGMQARALRSGSKRVLSGMAVAQFATLIIFPYALPVIALGTAIALLIALRRNREIGLSWPAVLIFGAVCGVMDFAYLLLVGLGKSHGNVQFALQFRPDMILPTLRTYVLLLVVASGLALLSRASLAAKATVAGLALSNALFAFSDVFFPASAQMLSHVNYTLILTTWLPLIVALRPWLEKFDGRPLRLAMPTIITVIALWEGFASYRSNLSVNMVQTSAIAEFEKLSLTAKDLVVASGQFADDLSSWVPLIEPARVLYTPNGENILSADTIRTDQAFRESVYLEMGGKNRATLISMTDSGSPDFLLSALVQHGDRGYQRPPLVTDRLHARSLVRERLGPMLMQLESDPASARRLFEGHDRVIVMDSSSQPFFKPSAFSPWMEIEQTYERDGTRVWVCRPR